ncbi:MAG TPA: DNA adenine methylase [Thermodesulfobacteriota bacterium]|nr:DNA adenine methylase [Thermodesulfobacteriota bacterium]
MKVPHPIQYQGSKRGLALTILRYLPVKMDRLVEPFAGSAAISIACAARGRAKTYWINDFNKPLAELLSLIINHPEELADSYKKIWMSQGPDTLEHYYRIREDFNRSHDPKLFLYLLARCVKGAIRYNSEGLFNQSPDKRRLGTKPETMRENILGVSMLLRGKAVISSHDYRDVLANVNEDDVVYMDPPYQGVCGDRDSRYFTGVSFEEFVAALKELNQRGIRYAVSYDGRTGSKTFGQTLPKHLNLTQIELEAGRSSQATLLGREVITVESLYLSAPLTEEVGATPYLHKRNNVEQMTLLETKTKYGKVSKRVP